MNPSPPVTTTRAFAKQGKSMIELNQASPHQS
jgi:hypothetical protein